MIELEVQNASACESIPANSDFAQWVEATLADRGPQVLTIRIVDREESAELNLRYRSKSGPTNVLSFGAELSAEVDLPLLGDLVICAPLVKAEAKAQEKPLEAHWAHLVVHGVLHLLGYDHESDKLAREMEEREIAVLATLGIGNPYET